MSCPTVTSCITMVLSTGTQRLTAYCYARRNGDGSTHQGSSCSKS